MILDLEVENESVAIAPLITNVSSGSDLAMRYFRSGNCRDANNKIIDGSPLACKHLNYDSIEVQWPFSNKLLFMIND